MGQATSARARAWDSEPRAHFCMSGVDVIEGQCIDDEGESRAGSRKRRGERWEAARASSSRARIPGPHFRMCGARAKTRSSLHNAFMSSSLLKLNYLRRSHHAHHCMSLSTVSSNFVSSLWTMALGFKTRRSALLVRTLLRGPSNSTPFSQFAQQLSSGSQIMLRYVHSYTLELSPELSRLKLERSTIRGRTTTLRAREFYSRPPQRGRLDVYRRF